MKNRMIRLANIFLFVFFASHMALGQTQTDSAQNVNENIIVYTDRDVYMTGETIWFSTDYLINEQKSSVELSRVLYVELFSLDGNSIVQGKFKIINNKADGKIEIPLGLESNYYVLTAYTQYQRNRHPNDLNNLLVAIINPSVPLIKYKTDDSWMVRYAPLGSPDKIKNANEFALQFNPLIVTGLSTAQVVDTSGNLISEIKLYSNGLGQVNIIPEFGSNYFVRMIFTNTDTILTPIDFDQPLSTIITFQNKKFIEVSINQFEKHNNTDYNLSLYSQSGELIVNKTVSDATENPVLKVPSEQVNPGLYFLSLKKTDGELISVKVDYKFPESPLELKISTDKKSYAKREMVTIDIQQSAKNEEELGPLNLTVVKSGTLADIEVLPAYLVGNPVLLSSFFKAHPVVKQSIKNQVKALLAIYNLGLDENKTDIFTTNAENSMWVPENRGASLRGIVRHSETKQLLPGIDVFVSILKVNPQLQIFTTDENGEFIFALDHIENLTNVYLTVRDVHADSMEILVLSDFSGSMLNLSTFHLGVDTAMQSFIEEMYVNSQVMDLYGSLDTVRSTATSAIRFSEPKVTTLLDDYVTMNSIEAVFNELVPYVKVRKKDQKYLLEVLDEKTNLIYDTPLVLIDDLPVFNNDEILNLHPSVVEKIEVMNSTYVYGDHVVKGIVLIYTNTNNFGNIKLPKSFTSLEFLAPSSGAKNLFSDYNKAEKKNSRIPDFRNTLYFNESLILEKEKTSLSFFASDNTTTYDIILRGTTKNGEPVFGFASFSIAP